MIEAGRLPELARCPRADCQELMTFEGFDALGRVVFACRSCDRNRRGLCRRCPRGRLTRRKYKGRDTKGFGNSKLCPSCGKERKKERDSSPQGLERRRKRARRYYHRHRETIVEKVRAKRQITPRTEIDRLIDTAKSRARWANPVKRAKDLAGMRRRYAKRSKDPAFVEYERERKRRYYLETQKSKRQQSRQLAAA